MPGPQLQLQVMIDDNGMVHKRRIALGTPSGAVSSHFIPITKDEAIKQGIDVERLNSEWQSYNDVLADPDKPVPLGQFLAAYTSGQQRPEHEAPDPTLDH